MAQSRPRGSIDRHPEGEVIAGSEMGGIASRGICQGRDYSGRQTQCVTVAEQGPLGGLGLEGVERDRDRGYEPNGYRRGPRDPWQRG